MKKYYLFEINIKFLNYFNVILLGIVFMTTYFLFPSDLKNIGIHLDNINFVLLGLPCMLLYFVLHELFHGLGYIIHGGDYKKITFGMQLEKSVFYCLCKQNISKKNILFSLMYPLVFLGIITYIISIIFDLPMLLLLSIFNIGGAIGDIFYFLFIIRLNKDIEFAESDDGTSFAILSNEDVSKYKHYGLIFKGTEQQIQRNDFKRIKISKLSFVFMIIVLVSLLLLLFINI